MTQLKTTERFVHEATQIHSGKYDYSLANYIGANKPIAVICKDHGVYMQRASAHLAGQRCKECLLDLQRHTKSAFILKADIVHGGKYDYSKVRYVNCEEKVEIICTGHGVFLQAPLSHLYGKGCPECGGSRKPSTEEFIKKARLIHGDRYDYSSVVYTNKMAHIAINCLVHGIFEQTPNGHLDRHGCPKCGADASRDSAKGRALSTEEFVRKARLIHGDKYKYPDEYKGTHLKVVIVCPDHGDFLQQTNSHLQGHGCPKCPVTVSKPHQEVLTFLDSIAVSYTVNDRSIIGPKELDIVAGNTAIEMHGNYWHSHCEVETKAERTRHLVKATLCEQAGMSLLQIYENEWCNKQTIIKSMLVNQFGKSKRIFARKCKIIDVNNKEYRDFITQSHLHGYKNAKHKFGLCYDNELVAVMSFNRTRGGDYALERYATALQTNVVGGLSKILAHFIRKFCPDNIFTFADRRFSTSQNVYTKLGFTFLYNTKPNYFYINGDFGILMSRQSFQKHRLKEKLSLFDETITEAQNMFNNGYRRIWDAGHKKYVLRVKQ